MLKRAVVMAAVVAGLLAPVPASAEGSTPLCVPAPIDTIGAHVEVGNKQVHVPALSNIQLCAVLSPPVGEQAPTRFALEPGCGFPCFTLVVERGTWTIASARAEVYLTYDAGRDGDEPYTSWVRRARCVGRSAMFGDESSAGEAVAVCGRCPVLRQCRSWALLNAVDGVAGGMTSDERIAWRKEKGVAEPTLTAEDFIPAEVVSLDRTWGRGRSEAILNAVTTWTNDGETARQIGYRLGVTRRTVNRLRARCRERET